MRPQLRQMLLLLLLAATATGAVASAEADGEKIKWRCHAWDATTQKQVSTEYRNTLPTDEQEAMALICATLSTLPRTAHLLAVSSTAFHPALNTFCRAFNVTLILLGANEGERVPDEWLHNAVRFYPAPELRSRSIQEYISWAMWNNFVVLYCNFHDLENIHSVFNFHMGPLIFRQLDLENATSTLHALHHLKMSTINNFILDLPQKRMVNFIKLADEANLKGLARSFLLIRKINGSFFREQLAARVWSGMNFTSHMFDEVRLLTSEGSEGNGSGRWETFNQTQALDALLNSAYSKWLTESPGSLRPVSSEDSCLSDCGQLNLSDTSGQFYDILEEEIRQRLGTVTIDGKVCYNFSFTLDHMYTERNPEVATWTASGGYAMAAGAERRHQRHFHEFMRELKFTVVTVIDPPFSFQRDTDENGVRLHGNDRWSGFSIDLFKMVASTLNLTYTIRVSTDGQFGSPTETKSGDQVWSGTVGDLMSGVADVAVASLVITYDRERVVDFTTPYMSLGLSVIMKKPEQHTDPLQFMLPFSSRVWIYMMLAWLSTSFVMFLCARISPYEWYAHSDCVPVVENQFGVLNSLWFTIGSLMQQGSDLAPRAASTRMVGTTWWFFTLLLISSYTANLAAFLTTNRLGAIESVDDLAGQSKVKYGCATGGAMYNFFKNSRIPLYRKMWDSMVSWSAKNESFVRKTAEGVAKVKQGGYAYVMESTFNQYYRERDCDLVQVGGIFNPGSYAFAVPQGNTLLRDELSQVILKLHKEQYIERLSDTWMKRFNLSGPPCSEDAEEKANTGTLDVPSFGGVFVSMLIGFGLALGLCGLEVLWRSCVMARRTGRPVLALFSEQLRLAVRLTVTRKPQQQGEEGDQEQQHPDPDSIDAVADGE